jgi:cytochrome c oxidase cbb3-type subunit II
VPQSNMPNYRWLEKSEISERDIQARMRTLQRLGDPYSNEEIAAAPLAVRGKTELDALVAYLQGIGVRNVGAPAAQAAP